MADVKKQPFNDEKHVPSRAEIELALGMQRSLDLAYVEHKIHLVYPRINQVAHWAGPEQGWGYRFSFGNRVLCTITFFKQRFDVTFSIPQRMADEILKLNSLTAAVRRAMESSWKSPGAVWYRIPVHSRADAEGVADILAIKLKAQLKKRPPPERG